MNNLTRQRCGGCSYLEIYEDMGARTPMCGRFNTLEYAAKECKRPGNCVNKMTLENAKEAYKRGYEDGKREMLFGAERFGRPVDKTQSRIDEERNRYLEKTYNLSIHPFEWISLLGTEYGELCRAVNETYSHTELQSGRGGKRDIIDSAIYIAAIATAMTECLSKYIDRGKYGGDGGAKT